MSRNNVEEMQKRPKSLDWHSIDAGIELHQLGRWKSTAVTLLAALRDYDPDLATDLAMKYEMQEAIRELSSGVDPTSDAPRMKTL